MIAPLAISTSGVSLTIHGLPHRKAMVVLSGAGMTSEREITADFIGVGSQFLRELLRYPDGWSGSKGWKSLEGELRYEATCDRTGHVDIAVTLGNGIDASYWSSTVLLHVELGQLAGLAHQFELFDEQLMNAP